MLCSCSIPLRWDIKILSYPPAPLCTPPSKSLLVVRLQSLTVASTKLNRLPGSLKTILNPPPLITPNMKFSLWQFAQRRISTRNWTSQSSGLAPCERTLNDIPSGCGESMRRRKGIFNAKEKSEEQYYLTTPILHFKSRYTSPPLAITIL